MGFAFRFESLLSYRAHQKERAQIALARARKRLREAEDALAALDSERREVSEALAKVKHNPVESEILRSFVDYLGALETKIQAVENEVKSRAHEVQIALQEVLEKTRAHSIMEKLKEKDYEAWLSESRHREQKMQDETAVLRHGRADL
ncbi:MAG: flagellar export protein FliJ [Desulfobacteraceae bacterium]